MKHLAYMTVLCACMGVAPVSAHVEETMNEPDSVFLFSYACKDSFSTGLMQILRRIFLRRKIKSQSGGIRASGGG